MAIAKLQTSVADEAAALALDRGTTAYEERGELTAGCPAIVELTADRDRASRLLASLRARGHDAVAFDAALVVGNREMTALRTFRLGPDSLSATEDERAGTLPYGDLLALVRAFHERTTVSVTQTTEKKLSLGRSVMTGGLVNTKTVTKEGSQTAKEREEVLYLFRKSAAPPWILRSADARYATLGAAAAHATLPNFFATIAALRERAPGAVYDERLLRRRVPERLRAIAAAAKSHTSSSEAGIDLYAHLLALCVARFGALA